MPGRKYLCARAVPFALKTMIDFLGILLNKDTMILGVLILSMVFCVVMASLNVLRSRRDRYREVECENDKGNLMSQGKPMLADITDADDNVIGTVSISSNIEATSHNLAEGDKVFLKVKLHFNLSQKVHCDTTLRISVPNPKNPKLKLLVAESRQVV